MPENEKNTLAPETTQPVLQMVEIQNIYFNGFQLGLTNSDIHALLLRDGQPVVDLNMSFTTAKTLQVLLSETMKKLETVTNRDIMTTREVEAGLQKLKAVDKK